MKYLLCILLTFPLISVSAQTTDFSDKINRQVPDCEQIYYNSLALVPEYYDKGYSDSALLLIDYWEYKCGVNDLSAKARFLITLKEKKQSDLNQINLLQLIDEGGKILKKNILVPNSFEYL